MTAILKNRYDDRSPECSSDYYEISQADAKWHTSSYRSKSQLEVKFQYGGRPPSETGHSFISAVDWDNSSKFGMQIDFRFLNERI